MQVSFNGYKAPIKTMWRRGQLPNVTRGLYGQKLTQENLSLEHLLPVSRGGLTQMDNLALSTKEMNEKRGNRPLKEVLTKQQAWDYISQFVHDERMQEYIGGVYRTFKKLGVL